MKSICMYRENRFLSALPTSVFVALEPQLNIVSLDQGTVIYETGDPIGTIYFPLSGLVWLTIITKSGSMIEAATIGREGAIGVHASLGERISFTRASVQVGGKFAIIRAYRFARIVKESGEVQELISRYTEALWAVAQQLSACHALHDASSRLCRILLQSADQTCTNHLPLTQEFLAQTLGVRRTTITLLARTLQEKGLIVYSRGHIVITDHSRLAASTCECYHIIKNVQELAIPVRSCDEV